MKQSQWIIAGLIGAAMVVGITYAMNFLGMRRVPIRGSRSSPGRLGPGRLNLVTSHHPGPGYYVESELRGRGHHDFWFVNPEDQEVTVGVVAFGCGECTSAKLGVLPDEARLEWAGALIGLAIDPRLAPLSLVAGQAATPEAATQKVTLQELSKERSVTVPAGAAGWVRLIWRGIKPGPQLISAQLWVNEKETTVHTLQTGVVVHPGLRVMPTVNLGNIPEDTLPRTAYLMCWSSTRQSLNLKATVGGLGKYPASDPFEVGELIPLSREERRKMEAENYGSGVGTTPDPHVPAPERVSPYGAVLCAYRIPITLRAVAKDGKTPFDIGPFDRVLNLIDRNHPGDIYSVNISGRVYGLLKVGETRADLGSFLASVGKRVPLSLESTIKGLRVEFDRERTPAFLRANPGKPTKTPNGQEWQLQIEAIPNKASGNFNSAIYLRVIDGKRVRSFRIPVAGTARDR